jgi:hypothetical protein
MNDDEGWLKVGEFGLDKLAGKPDPTKVTFDEVLSHYIAYGKKRTGEDKAHSNKITDGRNARLHLSHWAGYVARTSSRYWFRSGSTGCPKGCVPNSGT